MDSQGWTITRAEVSPVRPRPKQWAPPGTVLRAELWEDEQRPFPTDTPGYRRIDEHQISAIVTTTSEDPPVYCRDEDGDQPTELIGEDGWLFVIHVRPATAEEAADILAQEDVEARRTELHRRRRALFGTRAPLPDGVVPPADEVRLQDTVKIPYGAELQRGIDHFWPDDEIRINEARDEAWLLIYNGADGDNWEASNAGSYIAVRYPLTDERAALVTELRAEFETPTWASEGFGEDAARVLIQAGWSVDDAKSKLGGFSLRTAEDATVLTARPWQEWEAAGWEAWQQYAVPGFAPADAARLADAGLSYSAAHQRRAAGFTDIEEIVQAQPPHIPDDAGRIFVEAERPHWPYTADVTSDPEIARAWLALFPARWKPGGVKVVSGVQPVHVTDSWSLWDDGALLVGTWMAIYPSRGAERKTAHRPQSLPAGAVAALDLVTGSRTDVPRAAWSALLDATEHHLHEIDQASHRGYQWGSSKALRRHDFTTPGGVKSLWEVWGDEGGMSNGEGDYHETSEIYDSPEPARRQYADWKLT